MEEKNLKEKKKPTKKKSRGPGNRLAVAHLAEVLMTPLPENIIKRWPLQREVKEEELKALSDHLVCWAEKDESAISISQFAAKNGIPPSYFYRWASFSADLAAGIEIAKELIAARREYLGLSFKFHAGLVQAGMPIYSKDWRDLEEWRSALKQKEGASQPGANIFNVTVQKYAETDVVPQKPTSLLSKERDGDKAGQVPTEDISAPDL